MCNKIRRVTWTCRVLVTFLIVFSVCTLCQRVCVVSILSGILISWGSATLIPVSHSRLSHLDKLPLVCNFVCPLFCIVVVVYSIKLSKKKMNKKTDMVYRYVLVLYRNDTSCLNDFLSLCEFYHIVCFPNIFPVPQIFTNIFPRSLDIPH